MKPYNIISPFPLTVLALATGLVYLGVKYLPDLEQKNRESEWKLYMQGKNEHWKKVYTSYDAQAKSLLQAQASPSDTISREKILRQFDTYISERFSIYAIRDNFIPYDVRKNKGLEKLVSK